MKYRLISSLVLVLIAPGWVDSKPKSVPFKEVASKTAGGFCKKMEECSSEKIPLSQCISEMSHLFEQGYDHLPQDKKFEIESSQLDLCVKSVQGSKCDELKSADALTGCEFIEKLGAL